MKICWFFILLLLTITVQGQQHKNVSFRFVIGNQKLLPEHKYILPGWLDSIQINSFKFYVSNIEFWLLGHQVFRDTKANLIDLDGKQEITTNYSGSFDSIAFQVGVDSLQHLLATMDDDLDPVFGMYWAWQSGFIFLKLEGAATSCRTAHQNFTYHLGGYRAPFNCVQQVGLSVNRNTSALVCVDPGLLLGNILPNTPCEIMSPGKTAYGLSVQIPKMFYTP